MLETKQSFGSSTIYHLAQITASILVEEDLLMNFFVFIQACYFVECPY